MKLIENTDGLDIDIISGKFDDDFSDLVFNTKNVVKDCLFVCIKGRNFDTHDVIDEIVKLGAKAVVVERDIKRDDICVIKVDSTRAALARLSAAYFGHPAKKMKIIGITGTKGKTTSSHMLKKLLEQDAKVGLIGTNGITVGDIHRSTLNTTPESYELQKTFKECLDAGCEYVVMEVSSQAVMLKRIEGIKFYIGIFTNISPDHIGPDEHKDFTEYLMYKSLFFKQCEKTVVNADDEHSAYILEQSTSDEKYEFGKRGDFVINNINYISKKDFLGTSFCISCCDVVKDKYGIESVSDILVGIPGEFNVYNALSALSAAIICGVKPAVLQTALKDIKVNGRMEVAYSSHDIKIIIDYAHNAISTESLIKTLRRYEPKRLVVVFGSGGNRSKDRRYSMGEICGKMADFSVVTADNSRYEKTEDIIADIVEKLSATGGKYITVPDRKEAIFYAIENSKPGDIIAIIGKGHEDYQEIDGVRHHFLDREVVEECLEKMDERN